MHWGSHQLFLSSIFAFALHFVDGCGRTPARPKPTPATIPKDDQTTRRPGPPTTFKPNPYRLECSPEEVKEAKCLHGGECFALELVEVRTAHCRCPDMWTGVRCERIDDKIFAVLSGGTIEIAGIATGVSAVVIILVVIIAYFIILRRLTAKRRRETNQTNGYVCKPFIQDGANGEHQPYSHSFIEKSDVHAHLADSHHDHSFLDCSDIQTNGGHRDSYVGNSETNV